MSYWISDVGSSALAMRALVPPPALRHKRGHGDGGRGRRQRRRPRRAMGAFAGLAPRRARRGRLCASAALSRLRRERRERSPILPCLLVVARFPGWSRLRALFAPAAPRGAGPDRKSVV